MENVTDAADAICVKYFEVGCIFRLNIRRYAALAQARAGSISSLARVPEVRFPGMYLFMYL